nr:ribosome maturation factor RimM [Neosynechococcus sphagnicola]
MSDPLGWLEIGRIVAAQGIKGEVRVYPDSDFPDRFQTPGPRWLLRPGETEPQLMQLVQGRYVPHKGIYIVQFAGICDRTQAEQLRDCQLLVPASDRPVLEPGEFHVLDLIGLEVFNQFTQTLVGRVINVISLGNDLLEVRVSQSPSPEKTVLIPFVQAIAPVVDLQQGRIEITPPPACWNSRICHAEHSGSLPSDR